MDRTLNVRSYQICVAVALQVCSVAVLDGHTSRPVSDDSQQLSPFDRSAVVVLARIREHCTIEDVDIEGESLPLAAFKERYRGDGTTILVNQRLKRRPELSAGAFTVERYVGGPLAFTLSFGKQYLLLLDPLPIAPVFNIPSTYPLPPYVFSMPQGGFEVVDGRLKVLVRGGELDAYDGRLLADVRLKLQNRSKLEP